MHLPHQRLYLLNLGQTPTYYCHKDGQETLLLSCAALLSCSESLASLFAFRPTKIFSDRGKQSARGRCQYKTTRIRALRGPRDASDTGAHHEVHARHGTSPRTEAHRRHARVLRTVRVYSHQLLVDGTFNADPHGGNFLLLPDGRIHLIDYGSTNELTENERLHVSVMYAAQTRNDREKIWAMARLRGALPAGEVRLRLVGEGGDSGGRMCRSSWRS